MQHPEVAPVTAVTTAVLLTFYPSASPFIHLPIHPVCCRYIHRKRQTAASTGNRPAAAAAVADSAAGADDLSDTDDEGLGSADEMDCEDVYEEECEDDDMAGEDNAFEHVEHMEVCRFDDCRIGRSLTSSKHPRARRYSHG